MRKVYIYSHIHANFGHEVVSIAEYKNGSLDFANAKQSAESFDATVQTYKNLGYEVEQKRSDKKVNVSSGLSRYSDKMDKFF